MNKKSILLLFMIILIVGGHQSITKATGNNIEVFDIKQGKIIKYAPNTEAIQKEVRQFISTIKGLSPSVRIEPRDGMAYKIPVQPPLNYQGKWFSTIIDEVFLMVGTKEEPRLLVFDDENKPYVFEFKHDVNGFLKLME